MSDHGFKRIDKRAKDGREVIIRLGPNYARAYWTGGKNGMWAYAPKDQAAAYQVNFVPTYYKEPTDGQ